jgi:hypothetical protein
VGVLGVAAKLSLAPLAIHGIELDVPDPETLAQRSVRIQRGWCKEKCLAKVEIVPATHPFSEKH